MSDHQSITESTPHRLALTELQAATLRAVGKRLASSKTYWGTVTTGADPQAGDDRTVVRCRHIRDDNYEVTVHEAVGIISLPGFQVVVEPKIPLPHFRYLLERSPAFPRVEDEAALTASSTELWDLIAGWFLSSLELLLRQGLLSDYEEASDDLPAARGSIRILDTANGYYRGSSLLSCDYDEFGPDTALNRVLLAAAATVSQAPFLESSLRRRAKRAATRLEGVGSMRRDDLSIAAVDRRTSRYGTSLSFARHVLSATGRTIAAGTEQARTFLIRTPELVEDAVRSVLRDGLGSDAVEKRGLKLVGSHLRLNPDLVFSESAVGDVKYTLQESDWRRSDLYQVVSFATGFRVRSAAVFSFSETPDQVPPPIAVGEVALRTIVWDCAAGTDPSMAAESLVLGAKDWLEEVALAAAPSLL